MKDFYQIVQCRSDGLRYALAEERMTSDAASEAFEDIVATAPRSRRYDFGIFMYRNDETTPVAGERFYI